VPNPHNPAFSYQLGKIVTFDLGTFAGTGTIAGISQTKIPYVGDIYIIQVMRVTKGEEIPNDTYPFTHITVPEINLQVG